MKECRSDELQTEKCFKAKPQRLVHIIVILLCLHSLSNYVVPQMLNDVFKLLRA